MWFKFEKSVGKKVYEDWNMTFENVSRSIIVYTQKALIQMAIIKLLYFIVAAIKLNNI